MEHNLEKFNNKSAVQDSGTLGIPPVLKDKLSSGTLWQWQENEDGTYTLTPAGDVGADGWFWAQEWQVGEYEADLDLKNRNYRTFENETEFFKSLQETEINKSIENKPENSNES